jgi:NTE family protein
MAVAPARSSGRGRGNSRLPHAPRHAARIGLALAGGGPLGAIYEIGALCALEESLPGLDFNRLDAYVGVSAGSFLAAGLANGMSPRQLCAAFIEDEATGPDTVPPSTFMQPAAGEWMRRLAALPLLAAEAGARWALAGDSLLAAAERLGRALPTGLFSHAPIEARVRSLLDRAGRSNDFRTLRAERGRHLVIVATDLDSGDAAPFGQPGLDHVPISHAVAASAALPGLYPPVTIDGRSYVDGALKKTLHASVLLDQGMELILCLNPLVPFDATHPQRHRLLAGAEPPIPRLREGGLPLVLSQTFRSLIHSRLELGLKGYRSSHPGTDFLLFEPDGRDPALFVANVFAYGQRRALAEHAYQSTRADLRKRRSSLRELLARHGLQLDDAVLDDPHRHLVPPVRSLRPLAGMNPVTRGSRRSLPMNAAPTLRRLQEVLDDLERSLPRPATDEAGRARDARAAQAEPSAQPVQPGPLTQPVPSRARNPSHARKQTPAPKPLRRARAQPR